MKIVINEIQPKGSNWQFKQLI